MDHSAIQPSRPAQVEQTGYAVAYVMLDLPKSKFPEKFRDPTAMTCEKNKNFEKNASFFRGFIF